MVSARMQQRYREHRRPGATTGSAQRDWASAKTRAKWAALESMGLVRMRFEPDSDADLSFVEHDVYQSTREGRAAAKHIRELAERDGVWGLIGEYRLGATDDWEQGDSVWGCIGDEAAEDNPYFADVADETMNQFRAARKAAVRSSRTRCPHCGGSL